MPIVEVTDLRKSYGGRTVVDGVNFHVDDGEIFGILGPNGAGKTTTVECLSGLRTPDSGTVRVAGLDPIGDHRAVTELLGTQLQESRLQPKLTVREALELYASFYTRPADGHAWPNVSGSGLCSAPSSRNCRAGRSSACSLLLRSSGHRAWWCSTSSLPDSTPAGAATRGS